MGVCESNNENISNYNQVKIDGEIKDITREFLLKQSIKKPIRSKYKLEDAKIGHGSFGQILIGKDKSDHIYAIKIIKKSKIIKGQLLSNEIRIATKAHHRNILGIKEVYEDMKTISYVMKYCEGGDLFDFITKNPNGKLDDINTIEILVQILSALNYLHNEMTICHRDLKPENILVTMTEQNRPLIKLIDFGMASYIYKGEKIRGKAGTITYMAPEILLKKPYDEKIDIWSTGMILYNMTTGYEAFAKGDDEFKKLQILYRPINFDKIKNDDIKELCIEMLERDPDKRIDTRTALEKALIAKRRILNEH